MKRLKGHGLFAFAWLLGLGVIILLAHAQRDEDPPSRVSRTVTAESEPRNGSSLWAQNMPRTYYNRRGVDLPKEPATAAASAPGEGTRTDPTVVREGRARGTKGRSARDVPVRTSAAGSGPESPRERMKARGALPGGLARIPSLPSGPGMTPKQIAGRSPEPSGLTPASRPNQRTAPTASGGIGVPAAQTSARSALLKVATPRHTAPSDKTVSGQKRGTVKSAAPARSDGASSGVREDLLPVTAFVPDRIETDWMQDLAPSPPSNPRRRRILSGTLFSRETNPNVIGILDGHLEMVQAVRFTPDGFGLQSVSEDGEVWMWDTSSGRALRRLLPKEGSASLAADVDPDREIMATYDCTVTPCRVRLRDMRDPTRAMQVDTKHHAISTITLGPQGRAMVIASHDGRVTVHNVSTGALEQLLPTPGRGVWAVAVDAKTKFVATAGLDRRIRIWDRGRGKMRHTLRGHRAPINVIRFSHDGRVLASGAADGEVRLWNPRTGRLLRALQTEIGGVHALAFERSGGALAAGGDRGLQVWDVGTYEEEALFPWVFGVTALAFSPDNTTLAAGDVEGLVVLWDVHFGARLRRPLRRGPREASYRRSTIACLSFSACSEGLKPVSM